jgi:hypothetical protein
MQYILTEEEFERVGSMYDPKHIDPMIADLKTIIFRNVNFKCYHDLTDEEEKDTYVDNGYCDDCPLSFVQNRKIKTIRLLCSREKLYSK